MPKYTTQQALGWFGTNFVTDEPYGPEGITGRAKLGNDYYTITTGNVYLEYPDDRTILIYKSSDYTLGSVVFTFPFNYIWGHFYVAIKTITVGSTPTLYAVWEWQEGDPPTHYVSYSTSTDGTTWSTPVTIDSVYGSLSCYWGFDIFKLNGVVYIAYCEQDESVLRDQNITIVYYNTTTNAKVSYVETYGVDGIYSTGIPAIGSVVNNVHYTVVLCEVWVTGVGPTNEGMREITFDGTTITVLSPILFNDGRYTVYPHSYYGYNEHGMRFVLSALALTVYDKTSDSWTEVEHIDNGSHYDFGVTAVDFDTNGVPTYIQLLNVIYKVKPAGAVIKFLEVDPGELWVNEWSPTDACGVGTMIDGYFMGIEYHATYGHSYYVYQIYDKSFLVDGNAKVSLGRNVTDNCTFRNTTEDWELDQYVVLYTDAGVEIFEGFIEEIIDRFNVKLRSPVEDELQYNPRVDLGSATITDHVNNVYIDYCKYLSKYSTVVTTTAHLYNFENSTLESFFRFAEHSEGYVWYYTPDYQATLELVPTTLSKTYYYGDNKISNVTKSTKTYKIVQVILYGNGIVSIKNASNQQNGQVFIDYYPEVTDQTELDGIATNILAKNNNIVTFVEADISGDGMLQWGKSITLSYSPEEVDNGTWYIINTGYDFKEDVCHILASDVLVYNVVSPKAPLTQNKDYVPIDSLTSSSPVTVIGGVPDTRNIYTTLPLTGGGNLTADRTIGINNATTSAAGAMSAADKTKLDGLTAYTHPNHTGDVTSVGDGATTIANKQTLTASLPLSVSNSPTVIATSAPVLSIAIANTSTTGALSDTDWNTFNTAVTNLTNIHVAMKDPTGFEDRSASAFTLTDGANKCTVQVTVVSGSYNLWFNGVKHVISTTKSIDCSDDEGTHAVYFDTDDTLKEIVNPTVANYYTIITSKCLVTIFYWDATNNMSIRPSEERHGCAYGGMEHYLHHYETGLSYISGYGLSSFVIGDGSLDTHAQFAIAEGSVADEDIGISTSSISVGIGGDILYKTGSTGLWKKTTQSGFWAKLATERLYYNQYTGGAWQLTEVSQNGRFILMHHYLQSGKNDQMFAIMGQNEYSNLNDARNGAEVEIANLMTEGMISPEFRPAYTMIYQTSSTYGNAIHARIVLVETGGDEYISWLNRPLTRGTSPLNYVSQSITNGVTSYAPSEDAVYDALALKLANVVEDTTPQLGGDLDTNYKTLTAIRTSDANNYLGTASSIGWKTSNTIDNISSFPYQTDRWVKSSDETASFLTYNSHIRTLYLTGGVLHFLYRYIPSTSNLEFSTWFYIDTRSGGEPWQEISFQTRTYEYCKVTYYEGNLTIRIMTAPYTFDDTTISISNGWHHIALKYVKSSSCSCYIDRVLQSEVTTSINENPFLIRVIDPYMYIDAPVVSTDADFVHIFQNYYPGNIISSGEIFTTDEAYSESWNGNISIPTKNAIYDQFHALDIVYDTTPQLGGNLDTNYKTITAIRTSDANNYIGTANSIPWKSDSIGSWEIYGATYQFSTYEGHIKCLDFNIGSGNGYVSLNNDTFEGSIWGYCGTDASRIYLQVSGIAYTYDISFHEHHLRITDYYLSTYIDLTPLSVGWHHFAFKFVKGSSLIIFIDKVIVYQPSSVANVNTFRFGIYDSDGAGNCFDAPVISTDTDFVDIFQNYLPATICSKGDVFTTDEAYNDTWNGDKSVPTKNAIYDKIEAVLADTTNITNITTALKDPTGFEDRSGSAFTLTDGTNKCTVEVTVVSGSYSIWFNGTEHVISTTKSIDCSDDEGTHAVYFDTDDTLKEIVNPTVANYYTLIVTKCLVTVFYWDATNNMSIRPSEERHGCAYGGMEHYLHHYETGLSHISGYGLSSFVIGDGSLDTHAQFAIAEGSVADEDIGISTSSISVGTGGDILYKTGATGLWKKTTQTGFWAKLATNRLYYNQYTSGAWQLTEVSQNGRFILMHHYLQSGKNDQMFAIMGQNEYSNLNDARNGAEVEISNLMTAGMVTPEFRPAYTIIYQTSSTYTNTIHARIVLVETGGDEYISWLNRPLTRGTAPLNYVSQSITDGVTSYSPSEDIIHDTLLDQGASFPTSPYDGALFWNTTDEAWYRYSEDAAAWVQMGAGGGTASQYFTNNAPLYWRNAADDAWLSTINVDDDNVLQIGTDVTSIQINLLDNKSNAFVIAEGSNNYVVISTTNSGEVIQFNKTVTLYSDICLTFRDWGNYIFSPSDGQFAIYCDGSLFYYAGIDHTFYCSDSDTLREVLRLADSVEDAVNYITITNSATTNYVGPKIQTTGSDDNIPLTIQAKGSAGIRLNSVTYVGDGSDTYYLRFMVDSSASYIDTYQSYLICRDQHSVNNLVLSHVSDSDSYLQITNGKSGSSSVIVESAGTANSLILKAGASTSLMTYVGYEACQYIDSTSITHYKNTWIWSSSDTDYQSANLILQRSRSSSPRKVRVGDIIGNVIFQSFVSDSASCPSAYIMSYCTGEMGTNDAPADLRFLTSPDGSATPLEVLRLNTSVASADSYIIITNGKISTSISTISTNDGDLSVSPADGHTLYLGSNNNEIQLGGNGTSEVTLYAGTAYNFSANNVPIRQLNAAGTSYLEIIKIDADNILQIAKDISYSKYNHAIEFLDYTVFDNVLYQANGYAHKWKNNAGTLWLDMVHTNASDALVLGTDAGYIDLVKRSYHRDALTLYNNKALKAYNYAENAELDLIKLDTSNILQIGSGSVSITLNKTTTTPEVIVSNSQQYKHSRVLSQSFETTGNATISTETKDSHLTTTKIAITSDYGYAKQNVGEYSSTTTLQYWSCWFATDGSSNYGIDIRDGSNNVVVALNPNGNTLYYTINYSTFYEIGKIVANKMYHVRIAWLKGLVAIIYINDVYVATYTAGNYNSYDLFVNCSTSTKYCWIDAIYVGTSEKDARKSLKTAPLDAESIFSNYLDSDEVHIKQITITNPQQYKHTNCLPIEDNIGTSNSITTENYQGHLTARKGTWGTAWNEISVLVSPGDNFYYSAWVYYDTTKTNAHFINFHQSWTSAFYIIIEGDSGIGIYDTSAHYYYKPSGSGWVFVSVYYVKTITTAYFFINNQYINKSEICNSVTIDRISHQADTTTSYYWDAEYCGSSEKIARLAYKTAPINAESLFSDYTNTDQLVAKTAKIGETGNYKGTHCVQTGTSGTPSNVSETMGTSNSGQVISSWQGHNYPIEITRGATGSQAANYYKDQTATSYTFISAWIGIDDINKSCLIEGNDGTRYVDFGIWEGSIRYTLNGASLVVVCPAVVNTWYHLVMYWDDVNDKVSMWVDDGFIGSFAVASITGLTRAYIAAGYSYTSFKAYFDAFYIGLDGILARLSLSDKQTYDDRWTPYGLKGWHYLSNPVDVASLMNTETSGEHTTSAFSSFVPPNATRILLWVRWQVSEANGVLSFKQNSVIHHNIVNVGAYDYASIDKDIPLDSSLQFVYAFDATYTFNVKYFYLRGYLL